MTQERISLLNGKHIVLGVTGSIAAYKAADLASKLTQAGALVDTILTGAAQRFVTPLTFQALTGRPAYTSMWESAEGLPAHIPHIGLGEGADLMIIAPATAHTIARLAHGLADDLLAVTALAARCPLIVAPAMDGAMYAHPATQANLAALVAHGVHVIVPDEGRFASGLEGRGRLPEVPVLLGHIRRLLGRGGPLAGRQVIVTAGGTRERLDPVRHLTNRSSGKQGYALAQAALDAGADVVLISAAQHLTPPVGAQVIAVESAEEMRAAVLDAADAADALIMAAAVADFKPAQAAAQKIKKGDDPDAALTLTLARTPDILLDVKARRAQTGRPRVVIGFAAESENLLANAREKLARKGLDLIVANDISAPDAGFEVDTNRVTLLDAQGGQQPYELASKAAVAEIVIGWLARAVS